MTEEIVEQNNEEQQEQQPVEQQQEREDTSKEANFRRLREERERIQRERDELAQRLRSYEEAQQKQQQPEDDDEFGIGSDDIVEGKHLKKVRKELKKQQEEFKKYQQQMNTTTAEARLKSQYQDFDSVVTKETLQALSETYPEIAATIDSSPDLYNKAVTAYTTIKKLGIYVEDKYQSDKQKAQTNNEKPRPLASMSANKEGGPLTHANAFANGLTPELKKQLYQEMLEASKNS